jgi:ubiquinone/menaquinone biosynthesis C-methylase UbiE
MGRWQRERSFDPDRFWGSTIGRWNRGRYERVARLVGLRPTDRILDLGCGSGIKSIAALNLVNPIVGVDVIKPHRVRFPGSNATYVQGDARHLDAFPDGSFDVVISIGLLEHFSDADASAVLRESLRLAPRHAHVVPHRYGFIEPHARLPFFAL